jgi:hypothetical protein
VVQSLVEDGIQVATATAGELHTAILTTEGQVKRRRRTTTTDGWMDGWMDDEDFTLLYIFTSHFHFSFFTFYLLLLSFCFLPFFSFFISFVCFTSGIYL